MTTSGPSLPHLKTLVGSDTDQTSSNSYFLSKFKLYETRARFYLIGTDKTRELWKVLKINRCEATELEIFEDPTIYSQHDCKDLLNRLDAGNQSTGGLKFVTKAYGIVGFIKFLEPYYMILVTKRRLLGNVSGHSIYGIGERRLMSITHPLFQTNVASSQSEHRYKKLFNSIDLTKDFFFSYTYRIMWTLQKNVLISEAERMPYDDMFVWNSFLTYQFREQVSNLQWIMALVYGFFKQINLSDHGTAVCKATLIARRSRHFAGTRYLKRGVNEKGRVANDVETEQLVHEESFGELGQISSIVQHRGSIPLCWSQDTSILSPRPDIKLHKDDSSYEATRLHFENLSARYGNPIIVLNLVKTMEKKPRETVLCHEYANAVTYLNGILPKESRIKFVQWDFHKFAKSASTNVLEVLGTISTDALNRVGFYYSSKHSHGKQNMKDCSLKTSKKPENQNEAEKPEKDSRRRRKIQRGVLRSNCIDCLDRTNVAQFSFGLAALGQQMHALGFCDDAQVAADSSFGSVLMEMYENMGDVLALQYGGSTAHNTVLSNRQGKWKAATQSLDFLRAIKRHYSNAYTDGLKQDSINIFLGHYRPELGKPSLWQLDSDNHLQIRRAKCDPFGDIKPSFKRSLSTGGMLEGSAVILSPTLDFRLKRPILDVFCVENIKDHTNDGAEEDTLSGALALETVTHNGKVESVPNARTLVRAPNGDLCRSIFSLPSTIEEAEGGHQLSDEESLEEKSDENAQGAVKDSCNSIRNREHAPYAGKETLVINEPLHIESRNPMKEHILDYSERFVKWIHNGHIFLL